MTWRLSLALSACFAVAGCGGNPFDNAPTTPPVPPGGGTGTGATIPAAFAGNLKSATYNKTTETLSVAITPLGASTTTPATEFTFDRTPALDTNGFQAFTRQETSSNRYILALFDTSRSGAGSAGVAGSGQFSETVWGSTYSANEAFAKPTEGGLATYSGRYAGILNSGVSVPGPGTPFDPGQSLRTEGDVMISADFTNNAVEGGIRNRRIVETGVGLSNVFLQISTINSDGTFGGTVVFPDLASAGTYGGTFAGTGASAVVGAIEITPISGDGDLLERGVFVGDLCVPGDPTPCPP
jgi:hypothetical protein